MRLATARDHTLWEYAERYLGGGTRRYSSFSADAEVDPTYHPQYGAESFDLLSYRVPDGSGSFLTNSIASPLPEQYRGPGWFVLPVHPATYSRLDPTTRARLDALPAGPRLTVAPSANVRTVFVHACDGQPVPPHFLKLHFPARLSRFTRRLRQPIIRLQLWVADELRRIGCPLLPEVAGGYLEVGDPAQAWGYLVRAATPVNVPAPPVAVPLFALYGHDLRAPEDPTLLEQLVWRSGEPATAFIADRVIRPMVRMWVAAALEAGLTLEMHGQNVVFGFALDRSDTVVLYRDGGVYVDPALRAGLGPELPPVNVISRDVAFPAEQVRSLAYDSFAGHHAWTFLANGAASRLGVRVADLQSAAREEFAARSGGVRLLPETVYYYDDALHPDGAWSLVDTGVAPSWR